MFVALVLVLVVLVEVIVAQTCCEPAVKVVTANTVPDVGPPLTEFAAKPRVICVPAVVVPLRIVKML